MLSLLSLICCLCCFRDRAEERRKGKLGDYDPEDPRAGLTQSAAELQHLSMAETKYLGGDLEHTHLVKGLDFALLNKVLRAFAKSHFVFLLPRPEAKEHFSNGQVSQDWCGLSFR